MPVSGSTDRSWTPSRFRLVPALALTVAMHAGLLLVIVERASVSPGAPPAVSVEVTLRPPSPAPDEPPAPPQPVDAVTTDPVPRRPEPAPTMAPPDPPPAVVERTADPDSPKPDDAPESDVRALTSRILATPFLGDETTTDPFASESVPDAPLPDFRWAERADMITMLDRPLPDVPFADPQLVEFYYDPGAMGAIHRGFDRITPEFGWTSQTGFQIKCRFILIVIGCGWGRER